MRLLSSLLLVALAVVAGCYSGSAVDTNRQPAPPSQVDPRRRTEPSRPRARVGTDTQSASLPRGRASGAIVAVLIKTCDGCHGNPTANDAPDTIVTYADLTAKSVSDPSKTVAEVAACAHGSPRRGRCRRNGALGADEVAILANWIAAGMPKGSCGTAQHAAARRTAEARRPPPGGWRLK